MEEALKIISGELKLSGLIDKTASEKGAVITHPHPLYGGDMYNPVVEALKNAYRKKEYTTLRFDFRGTGNSEGAHDNGQGEQRDVRSAVAALMGLGIKQIDLAGYSFGAWVNAHVTQDQASYNRMVMVSPPIGFVSFDSVPAIPPLTLVVTGSRDDIAPVAKIRQALPDWNGQARLEIINNADHFYTGLLGELETVLDSSL
ncbi:alpha/beta hydrolase [Thermodesulfobacteriota bacterium]